MEGVDTNKKRQVCLMEVGRRKGREIRVCVHRYPPMDVLETETDRDKVRESKKLKRANKTRLSQHATY